jgi:PAS domain S-box-containing protein
MLSAVWWQTAAGAEASKRVVALFPGHVLLASSYLMGRSLDENLKRGADQVEVFAEFLDIGRFPSAQYERELVRMLRDKYERLPPDLLIVFSMDSLRFVARHRDELFPGVPMVFAGVPPRGLNEVPPHSTGVLGHYDPLQTLELALRLQPSARQVVILSGTSTADQDYYERAKHRFSDFADRLDITYVHGVPLADMLRTVRELPSDAIVILLSLLRDGAGENHLGDQVAARVVEASGAPVYGVYEAYLGSGIVGGYMDTLESVGKATAELGLRVLAGERPTDVPPAESASQTYVVDWRALRHWGLDQASLPPGTTVRYREPSLWALHGNQIIAAVGLFLLQTLAVVALLFRNHKLRAERALRESEERYRNVVEAQTDLICRYLPDTTLTFVNDSYCKYFGRPRDALIGRQFVELIPESDRAALLEHTRSLIATPRTEHLRHEVLKPDGTIGYQEWINHVILDARGRVVELQGIGRDVTQLRRAELEIDRQREQVTHLTRVAILGQLAGALAHELRQPLTAILSNAQAAQRLLARGELNVKELNGILDDIVADDVRSGEVIARLRSLLKKGAHTVQPIDLNVVIRDTLALARGKLVERRVTLVTQLASPLPPARGDPVQLQQVLLNLLLNAVEAMSGMGHADRLLVSSARQGDDFLIVEVADTGTGLSDQTTGKLFEAFFTTKPQGLGLGLSICQSIIAVHGGRLSAKNNVDGGATFSFTLPIYRPEDRAGSAPPAR